MSINILRQDKIKQIAALELRKMTNSKKHAGLYWKHVEIKMLRPSNRQKLFLQKCLLCIGANIKYMIK